MKRYIDTSIFYLQDFKFWLYKWEIYQQADRYPSTGTFTYENRLSSRPFNLIISIGTQQFLLLWEKDPIS